MQRLVGLSPSENAATIFLDASGVKDLCPRSILSISPSAFERHRLQIIHARLILALGVVAVEVVEIGESEKSSARNRH
jgi:hypothetical protein